MLTVWLVSGSDNSCDGYIIHNGDITIKNTRVDYTSVFYGDILYAAINLNDPMRGDVAYTYPDMLSMICGFKKLDTYIKKHGYMDHLGDEEKVILKECGLY